MNKRKNLVCQHLEFISATMLDEGREVIREFVRGRHGIYALYQNGRLYYVGLASNLRNRLTQHLKDKHHRQWDRFSVYITAGDSHIKELESLLLRVAAPDGNAVRGKLPKSENLRTRLLKEVRRIRREADTDAIPVRGPIPGRSATRSARASSKPEKPKRRKTITLRAYYKGKRLHARLRWDHTVLFRHIRYSSPSAAAEAAVGHPASGLAFWQYQRAPGDWVPIRALK